MFRRFRRRAGAGTFSAVVSFARASFAARGDDAPRSSAGASLKAFLPRRPAFRFFFLEYFGDARAWLAARDAYTRSVATNAMIGHVLGIGDRHAMNILVDCRTGEQVHIDFGIAFDQGKTLTQPETVPFRLTRDVVDGMGTRARAGTCRRPRGRGAAAAPRPRDETAADASF